MKAWGLEAACSALMAVPRLPSVPFLKPTGMERPEAISLWVWDSVVRAPMADQEKSSARYWGLMGSSASVASGNSSSASQQSSSRARCSPNSTSKVPSRLGSLIKPFQPTVVRGFSK
ncbi:hypothetical protein D3C78_1678250 [compost metagenome]